MHRFRPGSLFLHDKLRHMDLVLEHLIQVITCIHMMLIQYTHIYFGLMEVVHRTKNCGSLIHNKPNGNEM